MLVSNHFRCMVELAEPMPAFLLILGWTELDLLQEASNLKVPWWCEEMYILQHSLSSIVMGCKRLSTGVGSLSRSWWQLLAPNLSTCKRRVLALNKRQLLGQLPSAKGTTTCCMLRQWMQQCNSTAYGLVVTRIYGGLGSRTNQVLLYALIIGIMRGRLVL